MNSEVNMNFFKLDQDEHIITKAQVSFLRVIPTLIWSAIWIVILLIISRGFEIGMGVNLFEFIQFVIEEISTDGLNSDQPTMVIGVAFYIILAIWGIICVAINPIKCILRIINTKLVVTNKRIIGQKGIFRKRTFETYLGQISTIIARNDFWGKILRYSTIIIRSFDDVEFFDSIAYDYYFLKKVTEAKENLAK